MGASGDRRPAAPYTCHGCSRRSYRVSMSVEARYVHTNLIGRDWRRLARFYIDVFGCEPAGPERDQRGEWLDAATGVVRAHIRGAHLRLPGHGQDGPTLEIFSYDKVLDCPEPVANRAGFAHLAFHVSDVAAALDAVLTHGGQRLGTVTRTSINGLGELELTYARDPEGEHYRASTVVQPKQMTGRLGCDRPAGQLS